MATIFLLNLTDPPFPASYGEVSCAVRNILRKTQNSALILEKRCALMPHELALQAEEVVLQADDNFLKIGRIVATFLKIVRIFQNRDVLGVI